MFYAQWDDNGLSNCDREDLMNDEYELYLSIDRFAVYFDDRKII